MSLHTIVNDGLAARIQSLRRARTAIAQPQAAPLAGGLSGASMRILEAGLALVALATAVLIGLGR